MSQITVFDGTTTVLVDQAATYDLSQGFAPIAGGDIVHRFLNGTAVKQTHWANKKKTITVTGRGTVPPLLNAIDYSLVLTLTLREPEDATPDGPGTAYSVYCDPPSEAWDINAANFSWTLIGVEQ